MGNEHLVESETTLRFGMKIVALNKSTGLYVAESGFTGSVEVARRFPSVAQAKQFCIDNSIPQYRILAHLPGAVSANTVIVAESETGTTDVPKTPRFG